MRSPVEDDAAVRAEDVREARGLSARLESSRRFLVAAPAFERRSETPLPALCLDDPRSNLERRPVPHVPLVAAGELGNPVPVLVLVVADDCAQHLTRVRLGCVDGGDEEVNDALAAARRRAHLTFPRSR